MRLLMAALFLASGSAVAFAADAVVEEPVIVAPVFNWTGGYVGGQVGYVWGDSHYEDAGGGYADPQPDGFLGGVYIGYNYQMSNNIVVGADADFAWVGADDVGQAYGLGGAPLPGLGLGEELNWTGAVRGRLGYAVDRFLPYIAGGVAFGDVDWQINPNFAGPSFDDTLVGWTVGAGVEYAFTDNVIGRFEYRYTDYGSTDFVALGIPSTLDLTSNDVRFGLAWKF